MKRLMSKRAAISALVVLMGLEVLAAHAAPVHADGVQPRSVPCYFKLHRGCGGEPALTFEPGTR